MMPGCDWLLFPNLTLRRSCHGVLLALKAGSLLVELCSCCILDFRITVGSHGCRAGITMQHIRPRACEVLVMQDAICYELLRELAHDEDRSGEPT